ncbi:hypothetical protein TIFTF001_031293 [Ficus carica]|uniref:Uncharacterized protein n=1 Tax=Ficus carica TaxID=3494 RepID=A0AA88E0V0_FICCA|nr:hypothetical protein TIFTF001_031293 [Ficus carica]
MSRLMPPHLLMSSQNTTPPPPLHLYIALHLMSCYTQHCRPLYDLRLSIFTSTLPFISSLVTHNTATPSTTFASPSPIDDSLTHSLTLSIIQGIDDHPLPTSTSLAAYSVNGVPTVFISGCLPC